MDLKKIKNKFKSRITKSDTKDVANDTESAESPDNEMKHKDEDLSKKRHLYVNFYAPAALRRFVPFIAVAIVVVSFVTVSHFGTAEKRDVKSDKLISEFFNYVTAEKYEASVTADVKANETFDLVGFSLTDETTMDATIQSSGKEKYISATLNGSPDTVLGTDTYDNTSVQIYSNEDGVYYGIGDAFTWKKAGKGNIVKVDADSAQSCILNLKSMTEEDFLSAFYDTSVTYEDKKYTLTGKLKIGDFRNKDIRDQLYVMLGMPDSFDDYVADININFDSDLVPDNGTISFELKSNTSVNDMYDKMGLSEDTEDVGETTTEYENMNVDGYTTESDDLGNLIVDITATIDFSFSNLSNNIIFPENLENEADAGDQNDQTADESMKNWIGLNNSINYFFVDFK